jgi:GTP cyclohydrolase I
MPAKKPPAQKLPVKKSATKPSAQQNTKQNTKQPAVKSSEAGTPLSVIIRRRIEAQKARFHANDNISAFIKPGELELLVDEVAQKMQAVLESLVIDTESDHNTQNTSQRVAKMYVQEVFNGRYVDQPSLTKFPNVSRLNELMIIGPITVRSACSHHFCPIMGRIWIGVLPSKESALIGLSKYSRLTEWVMCRPQIQEEAVVELADILVKKIQPDGLAIVMDADHFCMQWRGVKDRDSKMVNSVMRGSFLKDSNLRREFLSLLDRR